MTKIENGTLLQLSRIYKKVTDIDMDFDNLDDMISIVENSTIVEEGLKTYSKLEQKTRDEYSAKFKGLETEEEKAEVQGEFIKILNELSEKSTEIKGKLTKLPRDIAKKAKLTILDFKVLNKLDLI